MLDLKRLFCRRRETPARNAADETQSPLPNAVEEVLESFVSDDGKRRVEVFRRYDGFFGFGEEEEREDAYSGVYAYPVRGSGLYETREAALRDAHAEIPWLREFLTFTPS